MTTHGPLRGSVNRWFIPFCICILALVQVAFIQQLPASAQSAQANDGNAARQILALVNEWRIQEHLWPLKPNTTLEAMAISQATYILPNVDTIDDESLFHIDSQGRNPRQRAAAEPYDWPSYGQSQQIEVGENAGVGSYQFVVNFWKTSDIHKRAALSNVYREVGVAAIPYKSGYLFLMDFGARPGVLSALMDSTGETLYLSSENSKYSGVTPGNMQVRVFDANGRALTGTQPWTPTITFNQRLSGSLFVLYTNTTYQALTPVDLAQDVVLLPGTLQVASAITTTPALVALPTKVPAAAPLTIPAAGLSVMATNTPNVPAATTIPAADLLVVYTDHTLVIGNNSSGTVNLTGLSVGATNRLSIDRWLTVSSFPVNAFPAGSCLMVSESGSSPAAPSNCRFVRSQIEVSPSRAFWKTGNFTVNQGDTVLATCPGGAGRCDVALP